MYPHQGQTQCPQCGRYFKHIQKHLTKAACGTMANHLSSLQQVQFLSNDHISVTAAMAGRSTGKRMVNTEMDGIPGLMVSIPRTPQGVNGTTGGAIGRRGQAPSSTSALQLRTRIAPDNPQRRSKRFRQCQGTPRETTDHHLSPLPRERAHSQNPRRTLDETSNLQVSSDQQEEDQISVQTTGTWHPGSPAAAQTTSEEEEEGMGIESAPGKPTVLSLEAQHQGVVVSNWERHMARLYIICDQAGAPRKMGDTVMDWLRQSMQLGFDPMNPAITRRKALMNRLHSATASVPPEAIGVTLESGQRVQVYRFPLQDVLQRHLTSGVFSVLDNLQITDPSSRWSQEIPIKSHNGQLHSGKWYTDTKRESERLGPCFMLHPLLCYIDKTGTDLKQKNSLEPLMMTSTVLTSSARESASSWFCLGFMPSTNFSSGAQQRIHGNRKASRSRAIRDYHRCLRVLLDPLKELQSQRPYFMFRRGDEVARYRILCPLAGVCGDNLACDVLCGRMQNYTPSSSRLSRRCLTPGMMADAAEHVCHEVDEGMIERLCMGALGCTYGYHPMTDDSWEGNVPTTQLSPNLDWWLAHMNSLRSNVDRRKTRQCRIRRESICDLVLQKVFASHSFDNAFSGLDFGVNPNGIHRATLSDILHTIEEGLVPRILEVVIGRLSDLHKAKLDDNVERMFGRQGPNRSSERDEFPRVSFTRGYSSLTLLSAEERVGQLFTLALLLQTESGKSCLEPRFDPQFDDKYNKGPTLVETSNEVLIPQDDDSNDAVPTQEGEEEFTHLRPASAPSDLPSNAEIKAFLDGVGLQFIMEDLHPSLPEHHQMVLDSTLQKHIHRSWVSDVARISVPNDRWDYRKVHHPRCRLPATSPRIWRSSSSSQCHLPTALIEEARASCSLRLNLPQTTYLIETTLTLHSFLKYGIDHERSGQPVSSDDALAQKYSQALVTFRQAITKGIDRGMGTQGWKLQKFLELNHFWGDIVWYGWPNGYSTSTGERGLKTWAKAPARTAQKREEEVFSKQVCERVQEAMMLQEIVPDSRQWDATPKNHEEEDKAAISTTFFLKESGIVRVHPGGRVKPSLITLAPAVKQWFDSNELERMQGSTGIPLLLEVRHKGETLLRAHPNYRKGGPWYDYVLLSYDIEGYEDEQFLPAKCHIFFKDHSGHVCVLAQESEYQTQAQKHKQSQICSHWTLCSSVEGGTRQPKLVAHPIDTISRRIYAVIPEGRNGGYDFLWVSDRKEEWPKQFLRSTMLCPHGED